MYKCVRGKDYASVSIIFHLDLGTVWTAWHFFFNFIIYTVSHK
jgi:hypothetical protein